MGSITKSFHYALATWNNIPLRFAAWDDVALHVVTRDDVPIRYVMWDNARRNAAES